MAKLDEYDIEIESNIVQNIHYLAYAIIATTEKLNSAIHNAAGYYYEAMDTDKQNDILDMERNENKYDRIGKPSKYYFTELIIDNLNEVERSETHIIADYNKLNKCIDELITCRNKLQKRFEES